MMPRGPQLLLWHIGNRADLSIWFSFVFSHFNILATQIRMSPSIVVTMIYIRTQVTRSLHSEASTGALYVDAVPPDNHGGTRGMRLDKSIAFSQKHVFVTKMGLGVSATLADERCRLRGWEVRGLKHNCPESDTGQVGWSRTWRGMKTCFEMEWIGVIYLSMNISLVILVAWLVIYYQPIGSIDICSSLYQ